MKRIELRKLISEETRRLVAEAISTEERTKMREVGAKLSDWANKNYQKDLKKAEKDKELRKLAETDLQDYLKVADLLKNGNVLAAYEKMSDLDTAARDAVPTGIWRFLMNADDANDAKEQLDMAVGMFKSSLKEIESRIAAGRYREAKEIWDDALENETDDITDALKDLEDYLK